MAEATRFCGYCSRFREASSFSSFTSRKNGKTYKRYCCLECKERRERSASLESRNKFGREVQEANRRRQSIFNKSVHEMNQKLDKEPK